jgi:hypothetical protein
MRSPQMHTNVIGVGGARRLANDDFQVDRRGLQFALDTGPHADDDEALFGRGAVAMNVGSPVKRSPAA